MNISFVMVIPLRCVRQPAVPVGVLACFTLPCRDRPACSAHEQPGPCVAVALAFSRFRAIRAFQAARHDM